MIISANLNFELGDQIGVNEGRNSEVFMAFDHQLDAQVVVKRVPKARFADVVEYFAEARKLYDARHPNVVDVRYACEDDDFVYLAMPHYAGGSVHTLLKQGHLTNRDVVRYGLDLLQGLHHVHTRRLVHFDVKPSNILIDSSGKGALADFGIAKHLRADGLAEVDHLYFLHFPPEYLLAKELPQAADIYQAGLTLYRMLVGVDSLEEQATGRTDDEIMHAIQSGDFPDRSGLPLHVHVSLARIVRRALEVDPDDRYSTVLDMMAELSAVDQLLDWQPAVDTAGVQSWQTTRDGQTRRIEFARVGTDWSVRSTKTNSDTGVVRQQSKHSGTGLAWGSARKLVLSALKELE